MSNQVNALDKIAKILGLYRDVRQDRDNHPIQVTSVTVMLTVEETETHEVAQYPPGGVVEGESRALPEEPEEPQA